MEKGLRVGIIGLGMVGEPIRRWFEEMKGYERGKNLFCFDTDSKKGYADDVNKADVIFVSVPTPPNKDGSCDTSIVLRAVKGVADGKIVVIKSTIAPGTVEGLQKKYPAKKIMFCPEFLTESQVWTDFIRPDRQLLGPTEKSFGDVKEVLALLPMAPFMRPWSTDYTKKEINASEAELTKYASNVFGYLKVVYGNMLADVSHGLSLAYKAQGIPADVSYERVRETISADPRIGPAWLNVEHGTYSGAGGYCFPKDMNAFIAFIEQDIIKPLEKKKGTDKSILQTLKKAVGVLKAVREYNRALLDVQGLSEEDVSKHNRELIALKKKPIRWQKK